MALKARGTGKDMIAGMFFSAAVAMIFTQLTGVVATIIDGIVTSRFLGENAYSAVSLLGPVTSTLLLSATFLSTGSQVVSSQLIGSGKKDEANRVFSLTVTIVVALSVLLLVVCILLPRQLFAICGVSLEKNADLYPEMLSYLHGYMIGIPALMLIQVLGPLVVMDGGKRLFSLSATVLCVVDVCGDLLNALVFRGGNFGMGLATSVASIVQLSVVLSHFLRKGSYFAFSLKGMRVSQLRAIAVAGSPAFVQKLSTVLRDLFINRMNLAVALSTAAVAARGVQSDLNTLMFCVGLGVGKTLITMTGVYFGAYDRKGLVRLFATAAKIGVILAGAAGLVCFLGAPAIARFYMEDPEAIELSVFSIRCMALSLALDTLLISFQNYLQGIGNRKLANTLSFTERFFIPVLTAFCMGRLFGSRGVLASLAVGKVLLALIALGIVCAHNRRFPRHWEDFMFLPEGFGGKAQDSYYAQINSVDDVVRVSDAAQRFCLERGVDTSRARWMALFVEEMAGNIIQHGKPRKMGYSGVDCRIFVNMGRICLILRDYREAFDPADYYDANQNATGIEHIGIRMVMRKAREVQYYNTFNSNNLLLYL